jgi:electron transport complex protein RnfD
MWLLRLCMPRPQAHSAPDQGRKNKPEKRNIMSRQNKRKSLQGDLFNHSHHPTTEQVPETLAVKATSSLINAKFSVAAGPYIHNGSQPNRLELIWLVAIFPAFAAQIYNAPAQLITVLCAVTGNSVAKLLWRKFKVVDNDRSFIYAAYNGLLAALLLPPHIPWWVTLCGMMTAVSLTYLALWRFHVRLLNPALLMAAVLSLIYVSGFQAMPTLETPMLIALCSGAVFLAITRSISVMPLLLIILLQGLAGLLNSAAATQATVAVVTAIFFLVADYDSSPLAWRSKILQALIISVLLLAFESWLPLAAPLLLALLFAALITPALERRHAK